MRQTMFHDRSSETTAGGLDANPPARIMLWNCIPRDSIPEAIFNALPSYRS